MLRKGKPLTLQPDLGKTSVGKWKAMTIAQKTAASFCAVVFLLKG